MAGAADKRALREAAERIERGIDCYGAGDYAGAERELTRALELDPENGRAKLHLGWVRDLLSGKRQVEPRGQLDEDALQLVDDALELDEPAEPAPRPPLEEEQTHTRARHRPPSSEVETPWDPVPLTPGHGIKGEEPVKREEPIKRPSSATLLGVQQASFDAPQLTPTRRPSSLYPSDENTASRTREWRGTPTGTNLPLLDVPELTDEQVQELLALDGAPLLGLGVAPAIEIEAEPTPLPHRSPLADPPRRRDATTPGVPAMELELGPPFSAEEFEQTPTRERRDLVRTTREPQPPVSGDELRLLPLGEPERKPDEAEEGVTQATNPFVRRNLAEYASYQPAPKLDELPLPPSHTSTDLVGHDTNETAALRPVESVQEALDRGDIKGAVDAAETFLAEVGGLDAEAAKPQLWLLERAYESAVAPLERVVGHGQATPDLDPRSAFLLSRLDGMSSADDLLEVSGMPRVEALRLLALLHRRGVVTIK